MKIRVLSFLTMFFVSLVATATDNNRLSMDALRDMQQGVRQGYLGDLSPSDQREFLRLLSQAQKLLYRSGHSLGLACIAQGNGWFAVVDLDTNQKLGENVGNLNQCQEALPALNQDYACIAQGNGWFAVYNMQTKLKLGENVGNLKQCKEVVPANGSRLACIAQGNGWYGVPQI